MKKKSSRKFPYSSLAIVFFTMLSGFAGNLLTSDERVKKWLEEHNIGTAALLGGTIFIGFILLLLEYFRSRNPVLTTEDDIEPDVKKFYDSLKQRYQKRYESKLDERFEITLEVSEDWDGKKTLSFTERYSKDAKISEAFPKLKSLLETKDGLLIVGEPGAGKTVLLLKVALNLLDKTNFGEKEAFPVIFNLASWSAEEYKDFGEWLNAMLVSGNGLSKDFAARLLHEKRLILLLDGLDELARNEDELIAARKRAACLDALNKYLDGERTVICCRIDEFIEMQKNTGQNAPVSAKVEVLKLTEVEVLKALGRAQNHEDPKHHASAKNLSELIVKKENKALRKLLCTPFYFTIALEVFYERIPGEINLPPDEEKLGTYLIEKYVERKFDKTPNPNKFSEIKTKKWLGELAELLEKKQKIIFELADLQPADLAKKFYYESIFAGFFVLIFVGIWILAGYLNANLLSSFFVLVGVTLMFTIIGSFIGLIMELKDSGLRGIKDKGFLYLLTNMFSIMYIAFWFGLINLIAINFASLSGANKNNNQLFYLVAALIAGVFMFWSNIETKIETEEISEWDFSGIFNKEYIFLGIGLCAGLFIILLLLMKEEIGKSLFLVFVVFLFYCQIVIFGEFRKIRHFTQIESHYKRLKSDVGIKILQSLLLVGTVGLLFLEISFRGKSSKIEFTYLIIFCCFTILLLGIIGGLFTSSIYRHIVLRVCFYLEGAMPIKYATFLDYAASLRILEKDGGQWRFRHQNLQEYFANLDNRTKAHLNVSKR